MELDQLLQSFSGLDIISLFFKIFGIVFGLLYLLLTVILQRQVIIMNKTLRTKAAFILVAISGVQIIFAVIIILLAIFLI